MRPGVIPNLMTFANGALQKIRMSGGILSYDEKCRLDVMFGKDVQQFRSEFSIRPVIEGHRDIRTLHMHGAESEWRLG